MAKPASNQRTYQTRLGALLGDAASLLDAYADLYCHVERRLFAAIAAGEVPESLKSTYLVRYGITARQFNAVCRNLKGKIQSIKEVRKGHIDDTAQRVKKAEQVVRELDRKLAKAASEEESRLANKCHQKKRRLASQQHKLATLRADHKAGTVRLCFGSKKLFNAQFNLDANGYADFESWRADWLAARSNQFFVIGSKDETGGCQGCVVESLGDGRFVLRLRLPNALVADNNGNRYLTLPITLHYGAEQIERALEAGTAISYRFLRDKKGWRVFVTTEALPVERRSDRRLGAIGVDLNADHLAVTETDRHGNPIASLRIPLVTYGCTAEQSKAVIGDAVKQLMVFAAGKDKPIVLEKLDFAKKKALLEGEEAHYARMLSSFAYTRIIAVAKARAHDAGLEVLEVNPAYTSVIGRHKFASRYGLSTHQAAALTIARRGLHLTERPNRRDHNASVLPVRNRHEHVWSFWSKVVREEKAAHAARQRPAPRRSLQPLSQALAVIPSFTVGENPARESSAALFG